MNKDVYKIRIVFIEMTNTSCNHCVQSDTVY